MKKHLAIALLATFPVVAGARCLPVTGSVELAPEPEGTCTMRTLLEEQNQKPPSFTNECFTVRLSLFGLPAGQGYAGVTSEVVAGLGGGQTATPAMIPEDGQLVPRQLIQTARSAIDIGSGAFKTRLYSSDVIVVRPAPGQVVPELVTEQLLITGTDGQGAFANARGHLVVLGNSIGQRARVVGEICGN